MAERDVATIQHGLPHSRSVCVRGADTSQRRGLRLDCVRAAVDRAETLHPYAAVLADQHLAPLEIQCRGGAPATWPPVVIRSQVRRDLVLAFKESLQNIAKHARATEARITMAVTDGELTVTVADNGIGFGQSTDGSGGDGLDNMRNRLIEIHGSCRISTSMQGGTEVTFRISINHG